MEGRQRRIDFGRPFRVARPTRLNQAVHGGGRHVGRDGNAAVASPQYEIHGRAVVSRKQQEIVHNIVAAQFVSQIRHATQIARRVLDGHHVFVLRGNRNALVQHVDGSASRNIVNAHGQSVVFGCRDHVLDQTPLRGFDVIGCRQERSIATEIDCLLGHGFDVDWINGAGPHENGHLTLDFFHGNFQDLGPFVHAHDAGFARGTENAQIVRAGFQMVLQELTEGGIIDIACEFVKGCDQGDG